MLSTYLSQIRSLILGLSMRQRILVGGAAIAVLAGIFGLRQWQEERNFKPLFQNLSSEDAGLVLERLKETGVEVRLADGGKTIKVPADNVDELRIQMASAGLPKTGRIGFELFDKANFGTSEFAEQVNYHRAIEGELERSVMALQEVESARVHITFPRQSLFLENKLPAKASVLLKLKPGAALSPQNIKAITHMTASAVEGLAPDQVSVLDMRGNLLSKARGSEPPDDETAQGLIEYRNRMEQDLLRKIQTTLEPLVGAEGYRAAISLDCDIASGDQSEESFDPTRSVMINSQRSEDGSGAAAPSGVPGTPSALPRPTSRPGSASGGPLFRRSENTTFQTSRVVRRIKFPQGQVKRMSASVLLDHQVRSEGGKRVVEPPSPERIRAIRELVAATVGFQQERGDQIIVEALPFELTRNPEPAPSSTQIGTKYPKVNLPEGIPEWLRVPLEGHLGWLAGQSWVPPLILVFVLGLLFLLFRMVRGAGRKMIGGVRAIRERKAARKGRHVDVTIGETVESGETNLQLAEGSVNADPAANPEDASLSIEEQLKAREAEYERLTAKAVQLLDVPKAEVRRSEAITLHIHEMVKKDPSAVANLIRTWLAEQS